MLTNLVSERARLIGRTMMQVRSSWLHAIAYALGLLLIIAPLHAQDGQRSGHAHSHSFSDPNKWSATFDDPERDKWQMPDRIIAALALQPTDSVADIGAGAGYLAVRIARHLNSGTVFAVDVEPKMVQHLAELAKANGSTNLRAVTGTEASANLPGKSRCSRSAERLSSHFGAAGLFQASAILLEVGRTSRDYRLRPKSPVGAPKHFRLAASQIEAEMAAAGFKLAGSHDFLPYQNFLVFRLPD